MFVKQYLIWTYVPAEKVDEIVHSVLQVSKLDYGEYWSVYWNSSEGVECFKFKDDDILNKNNVVKLEFSIKLDTKIKEKVIKAIWKVHPWKEPVIRIMEIEETRKEN